MLVILFLEKIMSKSKNLKTITSVAKQIRNELKVVFGSHKFNVSQVYSNTEDRLHIMWRNGPSVEYMEAITDKYNRQKSKPQKGFGQVDRIQYLRTSI